MSKESVIGSPAVNIVASCLVNDATCPEVILFLKLRKIPKGPVLTGVTAITVSPFFLINFAACSSVDASTSPLTSPPFLFFAL